MRPAGVTAVLLLVCFPATETVTAQRICDMYQNDQCGDGWSRIDENRCAKFIDSPKTFRDAQEHCRTLDGDLVSVHSLLQMFRLYCLIWRAYTELPEIWTGAVRSEGVLIYTDGSEFRPGTLFPREATNSDECFRLNSRWRAHFVVAQCSEKRYFVCTKEM